MKIENFIVPDDDILKPELSELIDIRELQSMMDSFYRIAHIPMAIIDLKGNVLVGVGWQDICTKFHRIHPETHRNCIESDLQLTSDIPKGEFRLYKCKNGMWDMATPIFIGNRRIGNLFIGQFFFEDESVNFGYFHNQASRFDFDKQEYIAALKRVPRLNKNNIEDAKNFFLKLANSLSQLSYSNIKLGWLIGEAEKLTDSLSESKNLLERSQEMAQLGSWEFDLVNDRLKWSEEVFEIFGFEHSEFNETYKSFLEAIHPDDREKVDKAYSESLISNRDVYEVEHRIIRRDTGEVRIVREKCGHIRDDSGNIIRSIGMIHDITEIKDVEKELRESKEKLSLALEIGNIGTWEWNLINNKVILDQQMIRMLNIKQGSIKSFEDFEKLIHEEDISHFQTKINNSVEKGVPFETIIRTKPHDGKTRFLSTKALVSYSALGVPLYLTAVCFEVTRLQEITENKILKLNEELLRSNKELERFAYVVSHDLQEPLRMVTSFTQMLAVQYQDKLDDKAMEYIHFAVDGTKRMYNLLNDLLAYSRINRGAKEFGGVNMNSILEIVLENLSLAIKESNAVIKVKRLPVISADNSQMIILFQNLISNSIKFRSGPPRIFISAKTAADHYLFSVKDEGLGIEPEYFEKIFMIFQRLHPRDKYEGTGIGLALCKRIVERHGGKIWVTSQPGEGSTFSFTISRNKAGTQNIL